MEDRTIIDELPLHEWHIADIGLLDTVTTHCVVITRDEYVKLVERVLVDRELPDSALEGLLRTAMTADRFAIGNWVHEERGCGCLIGEYLVAQAEIAEHNDDLAARKLLAAQCGTNSIRQRLVANHGDDTAEVLIDVGYSMDLAVREYLEEHIVGRAPEHGTVFIRDTVPA